LDNHNFLKVDIIGRKEKVNLTEFDFLGLTAKIDTGAYTSSIHCSRIKEITTKNGDKRLYFRLLDPSYPKYQEKKYSTKKYTQKLVKSSNGKSELRYVIETEIQIGANIFIAEFTLSNRKDMKYPILIGRKLIKHKYLVDVSKVYLQKIKVPK
jgi:hypothetical protein